MTSEEFSNQFDVYYNNITSNQAPGLTEYEKDLFLTKAQDEIVKNYFTANSKGNNIGQGFDDSSKRQADFSCLMKVNWCDVQDDFSGFKIDDRSVVYYYPDDVYIVINETITTQSGKILQVIPLRYDEYTRLMSKPFKRPLKNQAWRLINSGNSNISTSYKDVEIILGVGESIALQGYKVRYIKTPKPIITADLDGLSINGWVYTNQSVIPSGIPTSHKTEGCELDPILHEDILQRAVELAKIAWTTTGQDNAQMVLQAGQRSE